MNQLPLAITPKLVYRSENFLVHTGVSGAFESILTLLSGNHYPLIVVCGAPRAGKTHFAVTLNHVLEQKGEYETVLFDGKTFISWLTQGISGLTQGDRLSVLERKTAVLVDEAECVLEHFAHGRSGLLVKFLEDLRMHSGALILFSRKSPEDFDFDEHLMSRIRAGLICSLEAPDRKEVYELVKRLAVQRGLKFDSGRLMFIERRLQVSLSEIESFLGRLELLSRIRSDRPSKYSLLGDAI